MLEPKEHNLAQRPLSKRVIGNMLSRSFLTARLLTTSTTQAEKAVIEAIDVWNPDEEDEEQLFHITLRTAVQPKITASPAASNQECIADPSIPIELQRVLELPPEIRRCFVLRVLVGLPSNVCAQILHLGVRQIDQCCCDAAKSLTALNNSFT